MIKTLVELGADVEERDNSDKSVLDYYLLYQFSVFERKTVNCLMDLGASLNVEVESEDGQTLIEIADVEECFEAAKFLLENNADYDEWSQNIRGFLDQLRDGFSPILRWFFDQLADELDYENDLSFNDTEGA